jgi:hypothetical protein
MVETWECSVKKCRKPSVGRFLPLSRSSSTVHWGVPGQEVCVTIYLNMCVCLYIYICIRVCVCVCVCMCSTTRRILGILHLLIKKEKNCHFSKNVYSEGVSSLENTPFGEWWRDRQTVEAYMECAKNVEVFRLLFWVMALNKRNTNLSRIGSEMFKIRLVRLQKLQLLIGLPGIQ